MRKLIALQQIKVALKAKVNIVSAIKEIKTEIKQDNDGLRHVMNHLEKLREAKIRVTRLSDGYLP